MDSPSPAEDLKWLRSDPQGPAPPPPVHSRASVLPFLQLPWKDFERLCRCLAELEGTVEAAHLYGTVGQAQFGIDILVRLTDGNYEVWQTKRHEAFGAAQVREAVQLFLAHKWATQAKRFVLVVGCELEDTRVVEAIEAYRDELHVKSIQFEAIGGVGLTERLRTQPAIVDDFFDRPWVEAVCPPEALEVLATRISRFTRSTLRLALRECYGSWAAIVDPGLPIAGLDKLGRALPAVPIARRYVKPDVLRSFDLEQRFDEPNDSNARERASVSSKMAAGERNQEQRSNAAVVREHRISIDRLLASTDRAIQPEQII